MNRRGFFGWLVGALGFGVAAKTAGGSDLSYVKDYIRRGARDVVDERVLTFGPSIPGYDHAPGIQAAIYFMESMGGGTIRVLPGEYALGRALVIRGGVLLVGSPHDRDGMPLLKDDRANDPGGEPLVFVEDGNLLGFIIGSHVGSDGSKPNKIGGNMQRCRGVDRWGVSVSYDPPKRVYEV